MAVDGAALPDEILLRFGDDNVAVPIVDRLIHHSHIFMLGGESYRLKHKRES